MRSIIIALLLLLSANMAYADLYIDSNGNLVNTGDSGVQTQMLR